jgi:hypothetical protein
VSGPRLACRSVSHRLPRLDDVRDQAASTGAAEHNEATWILLNDELRYRHDTQRAAFAKLEGRAAILLGAATGALLFVAKADVTSGWLVPAVATFAGSIACALVAVLPSRFEELQARSLVVGLWLRSRGNAAAELANNRLVAIEENVKRQARFVLYVRCSVALILLGAALSTVHLTQGDRSDVDRQERQPAVGADEPASADGVDP